MVASDRRAPRLLNNPHGNSRVPTPYLESGGRRSALWEEKSSGSVTQYQLLKTFGAQTLEHPVAVYFPIRASRQDSSKQRVQSMF
jgi:hypothetical protein